MVSWKKVAFAIAAFSGVAEVSALFYGFSVPPESPGHKGGTPLPVSFAKWGCIQNWEDYSILWGWAPQDQAEEGTIGTVYEVTDLTKAYQTTSGSDAGYGAYFMNITTPTKEDYYLLSAFVTYTNGEYGNPGTYTFTQVINITDF